MRQSLVAAVIVACLSLGPHAGLAQRLDSLRVGSRIRLTLHSDSAVEGKLLSLWAPDSLRLQRALSADRLVYERGDIAHLDLAGNHGMTGVYLGLAVGTVVGYGLCSAQDATVTGSLVCAGIGMILFVPVFGLTGSLVPRWRRIF